MSRYNEQQLDEVTLHLNGFDVLLYNYGILTEKSDVRCHVGVLARRAYIFQTKHGVAAVKSGKYRKIFVYQTGIKEPCGEGYAVPIGDITDLRVMDLRRWPQDMPEAMWADWSQDLGESEKGKRAMPVPIALMKLGHFPFWFDAEEDQRRNLQLGGSDITVFIRKMVQVKCDYIAGTGAKGCSGNLFLQTAERNPRKQH